MQKYGIPGAAVGVLYRGQEHVRGFTWMLRPSAQGIKIAQHGGDAPGQYSGFLFVPERRFALTLLTNSNSGGRALIRQRLPGRAPLTRRQREFRPGSAGGRPR